ncbi:unnamed protein product [Rhodiola kirilowii]
MKYNDARDNLGKLLELGCHIIHGVDALYMRRHPALRTHKFDRIVFNFPHGGFQYREDDQRQITLHQDVVSGFLKSARKMLTEEGQVHLTHKTTAPFNLWCVNSLAKKCRLRLVKKRTFIRSDYRDTTTKGEPVWTLTKVFQSDSANFCLYQTYQLIW